MRQYDSGDSWLRKALSPPVLDPVHQFSAMMPHWKEVSDPDLIAARPLVSVLMLAYNHSAFIAQAIDGVVLQKTEFRVELVIGVDQSADNTLDIVLAYQKRYPQLIRILVPEERLGALRNLLLTLGACRGKYVAVCEGDDYWTHPEKVTRQVDILEKDPNLAGCFHECYCLNQATGARRLIIGGRTIDPRPDTASLIREKNIPTLSMLFRNCISIPELAHLARNLVQCDYVISLLVSEHGRWQYLPEPMAVFRAHSGGVWSSLSEVEMRREQLRFMDALASSNRYPALRHLTLAVRRNIRRQLGIALAKEDHWVQSLHQYRRSIGPKGFLENTRVGSLDYWRVLARSLADHVCLEFPLPFMRKKLARRQGN